MCQKFLCVWTSPKTAQLSKILMCETWYCAVLCCRTTLQRGSSSPCPLCPSQTAQTAGTNCILLFRLTEWGRDCRIVANTWGTAATIGGCLDFHTPSEMVDEPFSLFSFRFSFGHDLRWGISGEERANSDYCRSELTEPTRSSSRDNDALSLYSDARSPQTRACGISWAGVL